ncbi:MAG: glycosyltransferase [Prevotella sp.]|nr:glycosyltransferase [Prevotella sp.]
MESIDNQIVVSIQCLTYNHAPYIRQCLDGFVMQKTSFYFEAIVHDDASTDGTQDIIREYEKKYPNIIKPIYQKENQYSKSKHGNITNLISSKCKGKYIAICEGDDYWTDPYKLQKQVDYLESHPKCGMCYSNFSKYNQKYRTFSHNCLKKEQVQKYNNLHDWIKLTPYAGPMTWLYRRDVMSSRPSFNTIDGSFVTFSYFLAESKVHCLFEDNTAVYRVLEDSASHSRDITKQYKYKKGIHDIQLQLIEYYKYKIIDSNELITEINQKYYRRFLFHIIANGNQQELEKAINYSDKSWPFSKRLLAKFAKNKLLSGLIKKFIKEYLINNNKIK